MGRDLMEPSRDHTPGVVVIGGGPAGLMAAEVLLKGGARVDLYDAMPSVGRKFLVAGRGGLNLTRSESLDSFLSHYGPRQTQLEPLLRSFGPDTLRAWVQDLGFSTFVGTSGRVFPTGMKAAPIWRAWVLRLRQSGLSLHLRHRWCGWGQNQSLRFESPDGEVLVHSDAVILALGGGSWAILGSTGEWIPFLKEQGIAVADLKPANCGFDVNWSDHFRDRFSGHPVKPVVVSFTNSNGTIFRQKGEFIITQTGIQGGLIYALSAPIRDEIDTHKKAVIHLDLTPDRSLQSLVDRLSQPRGSRSLSSHLEKKAGIKGLKAVLLREYVPKENFKDPNLLASAIKGLPIPLVATRPLDEAISTAGGVAFEELDQNLMIRSLPGVFCAGEMLDWEAPTGGYLLTACFSMGHAVAMGVLSFLANRAQSQAP